MAAQMAAVEQQAVVVEEHEEEQEEFQACSLGPLPWPVCACAAGGLPEGSTCERGSPCTLLTGRLRPLFCAVQALDKLEALGVNKGDIKKARDAGAACPAAAAPPTLSAVARSERCHTAPLLLQASTPARAC
jgi:hypothetical protein